MKNHKASFNKELNTTINIFFDDNQYVFHLLFQIICVVCLVNVVESINIHNYDKLKFVFFVLIGVLLFDYLFWTNKYQTLLLGIILFGYLFYSRQQKDIMKEFYKNVIKKEFRTNNENRVKKHIDSVNKKVDNQLPNVNVLDFEPDNIHKFNDEVKPFNHNINGDSNKIDDTLLTLPKVDYSNLEFGIKNQTVLDALDDRHLIPLTDHHQELARLNEFRKGKMLNNYKTNNYKRLKDRKHQKTTDNWNLDRYYPKCKSINDYPLYNNQGKLLNNNDIISEENDNISLINHVDGEENTKNLKISNKIINYCTNLPEVSTNQYDMISNNQVELIYKDNPHMQIFPKQFDIGGDGIIKTDFREKTNLV